MEKHMYLMKQYNVEEEWVSCTLFPYDNRVTFWKEYCLLPRILKCEECHLCVYSYIQVNEGALFLLYEINQF
jgi:hypothetical protein